MRSQFRVLWLLFTAHVSQRPFRTLLTVIGVALGVAASVAVRTANLDVLRSFEQAVLTVAGPTTLEISGGDPGVDEQLIPSIRTVPGVTSAAPVILQTAVRVGNGSSEPAVQVLGLDLLAEIDHRGFRLKDRADRSLESLLDPESVFLGKRLAAEWNVAIGDRIPVQAGPRRVAVRVAGILEEASGRASSWDRLAVMDIASAQVMFGLIGRVDRIDVVTSSEADVAEVAQAIGALLPSHLTVERPSSRSRHVEQMVSAFRLNLTVLSWVGLLVGMFLIYNTMAFAVAQRRREIGVFRAVGMTEARVALFVLAEAALLGVLGGLVGSAGGVLLAQQLIQVVSRTISDLYVPIGTEEGWGWGTSRSWALSVEGVVIGCAVAMLGALGPSLDAARTVTVRALAPGDYETTQQARVGLLSLAGGALLVLAGLLSLVGPVRGVPLFGYVATFCVLAGLSCLAPICVRSWSRAARQGSGGMSARGAMREIAVDHAARNPGRSGVTVSALMVGLAIMIGVLIMVRSFRHTVELWINDTVIADIVVAPSSWLRGAEAGSVGRSLPAVWLPVLAALPGVDAVDSYRDARVEVNGQRIALVSRDLRLHARRSRYLVRNGDSGEALNRAVDSGGVLVSEVLANRLGLREGQTLEIKSPAGMQAVPIVAVFYDYATDGGKLVMDRALYQSLWRDQSVTVYPVYLKGGADLDRARDAIAAALKRAYPDAQEPLLISNAELRKEILEIFDRTFLLTYVLEAIAVIIAMLGIVNTLVTSVWERRRELATLRAIGGSEGQIKQLVLWEAAYLGIVGITLGLIGGGLLSVLLIKVINKQSFGWTIQMIVPVGSLLQAVGLAAAATLIAGYFPARWAAQQPVVEGLREE
ncbi:FtsX-like permease family protein [Nitrospira moscoviensis]|uniref:Putative ABC transporter, permease component n=1 Tax=Nitrospira moscoviensis TaxID=42253 RepID=A0A0K2G8X3_NITMO|nr:FtsX-like permease family protein [Nitrospira moscoviensis]ALA57401.1 putative ABC transporter, permease component [Nitrospira moscoviensis]